MSDDQADLGQRAEPQLTCIECERESQGRALGWRALIADDDEVAIYCPVCAAREFEAE